MYIFVLFKKTILIAVLIIVLSIVFITLLLAPSSAITASVDIGWCEHLVQEIIGSRNAAVLDGDTEKIKSFYNTNTRYGLWAFEHQQKKVKYLHTWADKQGINFTEINTKVVVRSAKKKGEGFSINFLANNEYKYVYENSPEEVNIMRIGTYHSMDVMPVEDNWLITREWYTDPFADSLEPDNIKISEFKEFILNSSPRDFSNLNKRRLQAVEYSDRYCGAAGEEKYGFSYNKKYKNYNPLGGDCTNFASQILFEGGKFRKTGAWNYDKDGSRAWVNAHAFKDFMLYSGRASLISYGSYNKVFKSSYKLLPGDIIAYEKKGKVKHISIVTGADSKGYTLVNCHNTDRYRVPWDLGWSDSSIRFWFIRVHY